MFSIHVEVTAQSFIGLHNVHQITFNISVHVAPTIQCILLEIHVHIWNGLVRRIMFGQVFELK